MGYRRSGDPLVEPVETIAVTPLVEPPRLVE